MKRPLLPLFPLVGLAIVAALFTVSGIVAYGSAERRSVNELEWIANEAGDGWFQIVQDQNLNCTWQELRQANGRIPLDPGTIVFIPPSCSVVPTDTTATAPTTTTTTVAPSTTVAPTTSSTTTTTVAPPSIPGAQYVNQFDTAADFDRMFTDLYRRNIDLYGFVPAVYRGTQVFEADHPSTGTNGECGSPYDTRNIVHNPDMSSSEALDEMFYWCDVPPVGVAPNHWMGKVPEVDNFTIGAFGPEQSFTEISEACIDVNLTDTGSRLWIKAAIVSETLFTSQVVGPKGGNPVPGYFRSDIGSSDLFTSMADDQFLAASWGGGVSGGYNQGVGPGLGIGNNGPSGVQYNQGEENVVARQEMCLRNNDDGTVTFAAGPAEITQAADWPEGEVRVVWLIQNYTDTKDPRDSNTGTFHVDAMVVR